MNKVVVAITTLALVLLMLGLAFWNNDAPPPIDVTQSSEPEVVVSPPQVISAPSSIPDADVKGRTITLVDMRALQPGDNISFFIPQENLNYDGAIEKIQISDAGNKSLIGMFDVEGRQFRFVFTLGSQYTFGTIHTPAGRYQLESRNGEGRIVSTNEINKDRDFSKPDYVIPERERLRRTLIEETKT